MSFELGNIRPANAEWKPQRILIYSPEGIGKTTFGATFEKPIMVRTEDGGGNVNVPTFPMVTNFGEMESVITALHKDHDFKTLLIDTADWLEPIVWQKTVDDDTENEVSNVEAYGYGKGYVLADQWWRYLMGGFDSLRNNKDMQIVIIAHSEIKTYTPPESDPYDRHQIKLHKRASALLREWVDIVAFVNFETKIKKTETGFNKEVKRGTGTGQRVIYTEERPAYRAKNRWGLPAEIFIGIDKTWAGFHAALNKATDGRYELPGTTKTKGVKK